MKNSGKWILGAGAALVLAFVSYQLLGGHFDNAAAAETTMGQLGQCGRDRYSEYRQIDRELSDIAAGQSRDFADDGARETVRTRVDALTFDEMTTYFVAAHGSTQELFVGACEDRKCTMEEMVASEQSCLRKHGGGCSMIAAVDNLNVFCLIGD